MKLQALPGQRWSDQSALWLGLDVFRAMLNEHITSSARQGPDSLTGLCAGDALGSVLSARMGRGDDRSGSGLCPILPTVAGFGGCEPRGGSILGGYNYYMGVAWRNHILELHLDAKQACLVGQPAGSENTLAFAPQSLTKADLMGELSQSRPLCRYASRSVRGSGH
jgi:hypothetical protein